MNNNRSSKRRNEETNKNLPNQSSDGRTGSLNNAKHLALLWTRSWHNTRASEIYDAKDPSPLYFMSFLHRAL